MLKSQKSQLTCSYCSKIFKDPILLPCEDLICRELFNERDIRKAKKIKCNKCNDEFGVKSNDFKSNDELKNSIESQSHLSGEEISLKQALEGGDNSFNFATNSVKIDHNMNPNFLIISKSYDFRSVSIVKS
jgi:hypothetical protein